jgi:hypothetical protein
VRLVFAHGSVVRLTAFAILAAGAGIAQDVISAKAGLIYFVAGRVSIAGSGRLAIGPVSHQLNEGESSHPRQDADPDGRC